LTNLLNKNLGYITQITETSWGLITGDINDQTDLQIVLSGKFDNPLGDTTQYIAGDGTLITFPIAGQAGSLVREVRNTSGATMTKGTVVYINGANGNKPTIAKAKADAESTSARTFGLLQSDIPNNSNGYVVVIGDLVGLDTSAIAEGTQLYLSSTTAGEYTTIKQVAPAHMVYVGKVTRSHPTLGQIEVYVQNGFELDELHDVSITSKVDGQVLQFESATGLWKNKTLATGITIGSTAISSGTDGRVLFQNGGVVQQSADLYFNNSTKTISSGNLFLNSGLNASKIELFSAFSGNTELTLQSSSGDAIINGLVHLNFRLNGTQQMKLYSSTNLMIGQNLADSGYKLHVAGNIYCSARGSLSTDVGLLVRNSANTIDILKIAGNGNLSYTASGGGITLSNYDGTTEIGSSGGSVTRINLLSGATSSITMNPAGTIGTIFNSTRGGASGETAFLFNASIGNLASTTNYGKIINIKDGRTDLGNRANTVIGLSIKKDSANTNTLLKFQAIETTTGRVSIGWASGTYSGAMLDIQSQGSLSSDLAFRIRNSANTLDLLSVNGSGGTTVLGLSIAQPAGQYYPTLSFSNNGGAGQGSIFGYNSRLCFSSSRITPGNVLSVNFAYFDANYAQLEVLAKDALSTSNSFGILNNAVSAYLFKVQNNGSIGIGTTAAIVSSAKVQIDSTTQGFLPPRMTNAERTAIGTPAVGLIVYCTDMVEGLYIYKSTGWTFVI
jgi:hypothetical protein